MRKLFSLLLCLMLVLVMLPTSVFAARSFEQTDDGKYLTVSGTPNSTVKIGRYTAKPIKENNIWKLVINGPSGNAQDYKISISDTKKKTVSWSGLTFTLTDDEPDWGNSKIFAEFTVNDSGSGTTVIGSNNMTRTSISYGSTIKKNRRFTVSYRVTDYNINGIDVDPNTFRFGGFTSDAFVLNSTSPNITFQEPEAEDAKSLATFDITLDLTYTGTGNSFSFTVGYKLTNGETRTVDCTTTIPKTEEYVDDDDDDDDDDDELDPLTPYIIVDSYDYGGTSVTAGEDFTLRLKLRNTSKTNALVNIIMNVSPTGVFSMTSSSNTFFIDRLGAGNVMDKEVTIKTGLTKVTDDEDANAINLSFKFQYVNNANNNDRLMSGESNESITLPVDFPDRFELGIPEVEEAYQGEECYISVSLVNKGRSGVYNLTARIEGEGIANPGQSQYIGNLAAGTESTADFSVRYNEGGDFVGNIVVTYEDANMNPKEALAPFNISVMEMDFGGGEEMFPPEDLPPEEPVGAEPEKDPIRPVMIAVGAIVCLMSAYTTVQKAKLKRSLFSDDDI